MKKIFTDLENLPPSFIPKIVNYNNKFKYVDSATECDFVLLPFWEVLYEYSDSQYRGHNLDISTRDTVRRAVDDLIEKATRHKKRIIIFNWSDNEEEIPVDNAVIFRTSLYKSKQRENEFAFPSWKGDLLKEFNNGRPDIRRKSKMPSVGFRGSSRPLNYSLFDIYRYNFNYLNRALNSFKVSFGANHQWNEGQLLRKKAMMKLTKSRHVRTDFKVVIRGFINQKNESKKQHNRYRFVENVFNNDYNLCVRGAGNYSYRFYETISTGRIPLFINTDCVLPLDFMIDWKKYCVWVEAADIDKIDQILLDFHSGLSSDDFKQLQLNIRKIWDDFICPESFFKLIEKHLKV